MRLKLDENMPLELKDRLVSHGHDAHTAKDEGLLSQPDGVIAEAARHEDRLLLTLDLDFADNRKFPPGRHPGIVVFRPQRFDVPGICAMVLRFIEGPDSAVMGGAIAIVEPARTRVRRPSPEDDPRHGPPEAWKEA